MAQKAMVDSVVTWARDYKVDGFRFDLMGHHSVDTMEAVRAALDKLTPTKDGVDGTKVYLYGEGWNFGEVADNALFTQAHAGPAGRHRHRHVLRPAARRRARRRTVRREPARPGLRLRRRHRPERRPDQRHGGRPAGPGGARRRPGPARHGGQPARLRVRDERGDGPEGHRDRLQRPAGRVRRLPGGGHHLRRRARQRDPVGLAHVQAADGHPDGGPRAHEHASRWRRRPWPRPRRSGTRAPTCCAASRSTATATTRATGSTASTCPARTTASAAACRRRPTTRRSGRTRSRCWPTRRSSRRRPTSRPRRRRPTTCCGCGSRRRCSGSARRS